MADGSVVNINVNSAAGWLLATLDAYIHQLLLARLYWPAINTNVTSVSRVYSSNVDATYPQPLLLRLTVEYLLIQLLKCYDCDVSLYCPTLVSGGINCCPSVACPP